MGVKSMRRTSAPPKKSIPLPLPEKPEDMVDESEIDTSVDKEKSNVKRTNYRLKVDDNDNRGQKHVITCVCCGAPKYEDYFYLNKGSFIFDGIYNRIPVCKDCLDSLYRRFSMNYDQVASAAAVIAIMDLPYNEAVVRTQIEDGKFKIGNYAKSQNLSALKGKTFIDSIVAGAFFDAKDKLKVDTEKLWEPQDKRNKKFVISKFGLCITLLQVCYIIMVHVYGNMYVKITY